MGSLRRRKLKNETILIAMYGATIGKLGILKVEAATNQACCGIVKDMDFISISLVTKPNQKYSVIFDDVDDPCRYPTLEYLVSKLKSKYSRWDFKVTNRYEPYSKYKAKKRRLVSMSFRRKVQRLLQKKRKGN